MVTSNQFFLGMALGGGLVLFGMFLGGAVSSAMNEPGRPAPVTDMRSGDDDAAEVLRARRIEIVDEVGTELLVIGSNRDGGSISVRNTLGHTILLASATSDGGVLMTRDTRTRNTTFLAGALSDGGRLQLFDVQGRNILEVAGRLDDPMTIRHTRTESEIRFTFDDHGGQLAITGGGQGDRFRAGVSPAGHGQIETWSGSNRRLISLSATAGEHGQITTFGGRERPLIRLTATADDQGHIGTFNARGRPLVAIANQPTGPTLRIFNPDGEPAITLETDEDGEGEIGIWRHDGTGSVIRP